MFVECVRALADGRGVEASADNALTELGKPMMSLSLREKVKMHL